MEFLNSRSVSVFHSEAIKFTLQMYRQKMKVDNSRVQLLGFVVSYDQGSVPQAFRVIFTKLAHIV